MDLVLALFCLLTCGSYIGTKVWKKNPFFKLIALIGGLVCLFLVVPRIISLSERRDEFQVFTLKNELYFLKSFAKELDSSEQHKLVVLSFHHKDEQSRRKYKEALGENVTVVDWLDFEEGSYWEQIVSHIDSFTLRHPDIKTFVFLNDIPLPESRGRHFMYPDIIQRSGSYNMAILTSGGVLMDEFKKINYLMYVDIKQASPVAAPQSYCRVTRNLLEK